MNGEELKNENHSSKDEIWSEDEFQKLKNEKSDSKNALAVAAAPSNELTPSIFKLTTDCCDEIFEYLSLKDLHSFGQSCKTMQKVSGEYFHRNFRGAEKFIQDDGIYTVYADEVTNKRTKTSVFNRFTEFLSYYYGEKQPLRYIDWHINEFTSVKHLYLVCTGLNSIKMESFESILPKIEILQIRQCILWRDDFYEILLKSCENLKRLYIQDDLGYIIYNRGNWLLRSYPMLEHIELTPRGDARIQELQQFFTLNPNIRSFCTTSDCFRANFNLKEKINTKLDGLEIRHLFANSFNLQEKDFDMSAFCDLLNEFYDRGFYKRLHFHVQDVNEEFSNKLISLHGLEMLTIGKFKNSYHLSELKDLKELNILDYSNASQLQVLANDLIGLERLLLQNATYDDLFPFIRHSIKLKHIKIFTKEAEHFKGDIIELRKLNEEREKLFGARKLTIYIEDNVFLATKRATSNGDINLNMIEMKRSNSICWDYDYSTIRTIQ